MIDIDQFCRHRDVLSAIARQRDIQIVRTRSIIFDNLLRSILVGNGQLLRDCVNAQIIDVCLDRKRADLERRVIGAEFLCIDVRSNAKLGRRCLEQPRVLAFALSPADILGDRMSQISLAIPRGKVHRAINDRVA